eukprot:m.108002 g.108002  ORF g.108002 m.108002 type:complete len:291 (+) comp16940_c0_seq2:105-977(+)
MAGFCPVPHAFRDQVWLGVGAIAGAAVAYSLFKKNTRSTGLQGLELCYWNGRGLMEVSRMMLAIAGKFPGDYKDRRFTTDKPDGSGVEHMDVMNEAMAANLGRLPIARVGEDSVGQSTAIYYLIASECGLMGDTNLEAAKILSVAETLSECMKAYRSEIPYGTEPSSEKLEQWFTAGATDTTGRADMSTRSERYIKWYMGRLEHIIGAGGVAVGTHISLADVLIYNYFAETLSDAQAADTVPQYKREPFGSSKLMDATLPSFPKIQAVCKAVAAHPGAQKWLATRGVQKF